jgi:hypothetical protein
MIVRLRLMMFLFLIGMPIYGLHAQEHVVLDSYTCGDFLRDAREPADGERLLRSLMMIAWATGFAAAHQEGEPRADVKAVQLIAATLGDACRKEPTQSAVHAIEGVVDQLSKPQSQETVSSEAALTTTVQPIVSGSFRAYDNYDLNGADIRKLQRIEQQSCSEACMDEPLCKAYSYDKWNKYCYLKNAASPLTVDAGSITGVRGGIEEPTISGTKIRLERRSAKKFSGRQFRAPYKATLDVCQTTCEDNAKCLGYTFFKRTSTCELFESITTFVSDETGTSAFKTQNPP